MDLRLLLMPLFAMGLSALVVLAFTFGRRDATVAGGRPPLAGFGLLGMGCLLVAMGVFEDAPMVPLSSEVLRKAGALALVMAAAGLVLLGSRMRRRADTLVGSAPLSLDEAVAALREGRSSGCAVFRGKLGASEVLTAPSGLDCAFYDAELRGVMPDGSRGPLLCTERGYATLITLEGERTRAVVSVAPERVMAPVRIRRCEPSRLPMPPATWVPDKGRPWEALSWERTGLLGESCLVVGELQPGPVRGSYVLRGPGGGPAMVVLGSEGLRPGEVLGRKAWGMFAAAGVLSVAAAFVLARSF